MVDLVIRRPPCENRSLAGIVPALIVNVELRLTSRQHLPGPTSNIPEIFQDLSQLMLIFWDVVESRFGLLRVPPCIYYGR